MVELFCLVDYFNIAALKQGQRASYADHLAALEILIAKLTGASQTLKPRPDELRVRLYGGWHNASTDGPTEAREILGKIARRHYPTRGTLRIFVELADALMALPNVQLPHTLRNWPGLLPVAMKSAQECCPDDPLTCPMHDLRSWQKGKCPRWEVCGIRSRQVIETQGQKVVDTALVSDAIMLAHRPTSWVASVSNDDDIFAGVATASQFSTNVLLIRIARRKPSPYDLLMDRWQISYLDL